MDERCDKSILLEALKDAGGIVKGEQRIHCPFHDDRSPSAGIVQGDDGHWRFVCHGASCGFSGDVYDVRARSAGADPVEVFKRSRSEAAAGNAKQVKRYESIKELEQSFRNRTATYVYSDPKTRRADLIVLRIEEDGKKRFIQAHQNGDGIVLKKPAGKQPLYNRTRVLNSEQIIVGEGEKVVHALHRHGFIATTSPGGAGKAHFADWSPLAGKRVFLWPDNDEGGVKHMRDVAAILETLDPAPSVQWIDARQCALPPKGDAADLLSRYSDDELARDTVEELMEDAVSLSASSGLKDIIERTITGEHRAVRFPWQALSRLTKALLPGTVTLICGDPGASKSFLLIEAMAHWHEEGEKVAMYVLEKDRTYHLHRALAQRAGCSDLLDDDWIRANPDESRAYFYEHDAFLADFGGVIYASPGVDVTHNDMLAWMEERCKAGCRVLAIDPVTLLQPSDKPWIADQNFMRAAERLMRDYERSLVVITHPKKGRKNAVGLDELAGGAAYARACDTSIWLEDYKEGREATVMRSGGFPQTIQVNRLINIGKARAGRGAGLRIGYWFNRTTLRFEERGIVKELHK